MKRLPLSTSRGISKAANLERAGNHKEKRLVLVHPFAPNSQQVLSVSRVHVHSIAAGQPTPPRIFDFSSCVSPVAAISDEGETRRKSDGSVQRQSVA